MNGEERGFYIREKLKDEWPQIYDGLECLLDGPLERKFGDAERTPLAERLNLWQRFWKKIKGLFHGKQNKK